MTKDEMIASLEEFLRLHHLDGSSPAYNIATISAMNLLADLKGHKVQFCRKPARLNPPEE
jgi:hypothetical protein